MIGVCNLPTAYQCTRCHSFNLVLLPHGRNGGESGLLRDEHCAIKQARYMDTAPSYSVRFTHRDTEVGEVQLPYPESLPACPRPWPEITWDITPSLYGITKQFAATCGHVRYTAQQLDLEEVKRYSPSQRSAWLSHHHRPGVSKVKQSSDGTWWVYYVQWCNGRVFSMRRSGVVDHRHFAAMQTTFALGGERAVIELVNSMEPDRLWSVNTGHYEVPALTPDTLGSWRQERIDTKALQLMLWVSPEWRSR